VSGGYRNDVPIFLASLSASFWGTTNFVGGAASRRLSAFTVLLWTTVGNFAVVLPVAIATASFTGRDFAWGLFAGLWALAGMITMYDGFAHGRMSVVAPIIAMESCAVPFVTRTAEGNPHSSFALLGVAAAVAAVVLLTRSAETHDGIAPEHLVTPRDDRRALVSATTAGLSFGVMILCLAQARPSAGVWPLVAERLLMLVLLTLFLRFRGEGAIARPALPLLLTSGLIGATGDTSYQYALYGGDVALVSVVAGLHPATTILLARLVLKEQLRAPQFAGLAVALTSVALISIG
jgi:drug/metabolite transporter (DMT)-like permease